ncbi:MAG: hypothetical protein ACK5MD_08305 [Flavobacteriales bacterium]
MHNLNICPSLSLHAYIVGAKRNFALLVITSYIADVTTAFSPDVGCHSKTEPHKMKNSKILILLFSLFFGYSFGQNKNETEFREPFTLKIAVDSTTFYQQEVPKSKYIPKDDILQIYPGDKLFIEAELTEGKTALLKVVKENLNPKKTIEIEFTQNVENRMNKGMMLKVKNPFEKSLRYDAMMYIVGRNEWIETSIIPVRPKLMTFEMWNDAIITLVLSKWRLE